MEFLNGSKIDINKYQKVDNDIRELKNIDIERLKTTYSTVFNGISIKYKLQPIEILIVSNIHSLSLKHGCCYASQKTFADLLNVSVPTISTNLKNLEQKGIIIKSETKSKFGTLRWKVVDEVGEYIKELKQQIDIERQHKKSLDNNY